MVEGADINEVLHDLPLFKNFIYSLYNAQYADFFVALGKYVISTFIESFGVPKLAILIIMINLIMWSKTGGEVKACSFIIL